MYGPPNSTPYRVLKRELYCSGCERYRLMKFLTKLPNGLIFVKYYKNENARDSGIIYPCYTTHAL